MAACQAVVASSVRGYGDSSVGGTFPTRISKFRADGRVLPQYIWIRQARGTMQEAVRLGAKSVRVPRSSRLLRFASDRARPAEVDRGFKSSPHFDGDVEAVF